MIDIASEQEYALAMNTHPVTGPDHTLDNAFLKHDNSGRNSPLFSSCPVLLHDDGKFEFLQDSKIIGTLHPGPPMRFEGDTEESAKLFFQHVCRLAKQS